MQKKMQNRLHEATSRVYQKYRLTKVKLLLIVLGIAALIIILDGLNGTHLSPFDSEVSLDHPCSIAVSDGGSVVADHQHTQLIFLNQDQKVTNITGLTNSGSAINWAGEMLIVGDEVYVLGAVYVNQGMYLESESIEIYSLSGQYIRELYKVSYDAESMEIRPHLLTLWLESGQLKAAGYEEGEFFVQSIGQTGEVSEEKRYATETSILTAQFFDDQILAYGRNGQIYYAEEVSGSLVNCDYDDYQAKFLKNYHLDELIMKELSSVSSLYNIVLRETEENTAATLFCMTKDEDKIYVYSFEDCKFSEVTGFELSSFWTLKNFLFWIFVAYGAVMAVVGIIYVLFIKKKILEWQRFLMLVLMVTLVTGIYTYYSYNRIKQTYTGEITMLGEQVTAELQNGYGDVLANVANSGLSVYTESAAGRSEIVRMENFLNNMSAACGKDVGFFINVQYVQQDGSTLMMADSRQSTMISEVVKEKTTDLQESVSGVRQISDVNGNYLVEYRTIKDGEDQMRFIVETGCYEGNLLKQLRTEAVNLLVNLLALLITVWISYSVIRDIPKSLTDFRKKRDQGDPDAPVELSGLFTFIQQMAALIDTVILVYVINSMMADFDSSLLSVASAVIMTIYSAGMLIGNSIFFQLRIRIGEQKIGIIASVGGMLSYGIMALAVSTNSLDLLGIGKFFSGIFVGSHLLILARGLPLDSKNEKIRATGLNENQQAYTAGAVLSALLAGYLSQYIAYTAIYCVGAVLCVLMLLLTLKAFKPGVNEEVRNQYIVMKAQTKGIKGLIQRTPWMFYKTPAALTFIVFYTFPFVLSNGYQTYLFPLYSAGAGISALLLSNITVFGQAIAFFTNKLVLEVTYDWDRLRKMIGYMTIICICFVCFYFSPNIWWAIVVLFIQYILFRIPRVGTTVYLSELAEEAGYNPRTVQPKYYTIEGLFNSVQAPLLKTFISMAGAYASVALGIFCSIFIGIFAGLTGKRRKKEAQK